MRKLHLHLRDVTDMSMPLPLSSRTPSEGPPKGSVQGRLQNLLRLHLYGVVQKQVS
jgi:hypothetical protein